MSRSNLFLTDDSADDSVGRGDEWPPAPLVAERSGRLNDWWRSARRVVVGRSLWSTVARASVLGLLVAGVTTWAVYDRTVTVEIDGTAQEVRIFGTEVSDALAAAGLEPGDRDVVAPAVGDNIGDGDTLVVRFARPLTITTDGVEQTYWTHERTVSAAVTAIGLRIDGARLSTSRSAAIGRDGLDLDIVTRKDATVIVAGVAQPVASTALTVAELLVDADIAVDGDDRVSPGAQTPVSRGMTVTVNRVDVTEVVESVAIATPVSTVESAELFVGETEVVQAGADGVEQITFSVTSVDGVEESRAEVSRVVATPAVERIVAKGTKVRPAPAAPSGPAPGGGGTPAAPVSSDVDSLNWAALAQCESGGNPTIVSSNGLYHGLYQFDAGTWRSVGGSGVASQAPSGEQTARAKALYQSRGASPWPVCGRRLFS